MKKRRRRAKRIFIYATLALFVLCLNIAAALALYLMITFRDLPPLSEFSSRLVNQSTKIYDRSGQILLYEIHGDEKRTIVPFDSMPEYLKQATLAAEDVNFYNEPAFDWKGIARALIINIKERKISQGGSTITQQLVKNVFLTPEKTFTRKFKELFLAIELESKYSKKEIFDFYLNQIPYGSNAYGTEAASQTYFNKPVNEINLAEAAILASLPKAPSYYSPWGTHLSELLSRKDYILNRMELLGEITKEEKERAQKYDLQFAPPSIGLIKAPHFSLVVKDLLVEKFGEEMVMNGGLRIISSLDWDMQQIAEKAVTEGVKKNEELYEGKNGALVAQDSNTGQILAMVGSRDYFDQNIDGNFNVATQGLRQPGSALKPFAYLTAFQKGYGPKTVVFDAETEFDTTGEEDKSYKPQNFNEQFRGPTTLEEGLAQSINIPSVKILYLAGLDDVLSNIKKFGITTLKERWRYGLSLILGGGEVKLIDLINAYSVFAEEGVAHKQSLILKVENSNGKIIEEYADESKRVIEPQYPRLINQILSDKQLRSSLFQNSLGLTVFGDKDVALKTGTTNDYRDAWAMGYTPSLVVGVWAGNNDNAPMQKHGSSILAAIPIWNAFLKEVLAKYPTELFTKPESVAPTVKPMLNGESVFNPVVNGKNYPQIHNILYYINKRDPSGPIPENPEQDSQFQNWEKAVLEWAQKNIADFANYNQPIAVNALLEETKNQYTVSKNIVITNVNPENGAFINSSVLIKAELNSPQSPLAKVEFYFNKKLINAIFLSSNNYKYQYNASLELEPQNTIEIKAYNANGEIAKQTIVVFQKK